MRWSKTITVVDCHAEGESGQVVVGGVPPIPGDTVFDKRMYLQNHADDLRRMILFEPRGSVHHNANLLVPSNDPRAQMGYIILESMEYPAMSGSNTICVATVLLETGILPMSEPTTELVLESPAGLITVTCDCRDGKVERVRFVNQPAFCYHLDAIVSVPGVGELVVDIAYGGMTYVMVDAAALGFVLEPSEARALCERPSRESGDSRHHPGRVHWSPSPRRRHPASAQHRNRLPRPGGSITVRHRHLRAPCATACPRVDRGRRELCPRVDHRDHLRQLGPLDRQCRELPGSHPCRGRPGLDHRHIPDGHGPHGPIPPRVHRHGYLAAPDRHNGPRADRRGVGDLLRAGHAKPIGHIDAGLTATRTRLYRWPGPEQAQDLVPAQSEHVCRFGLLDRDQLHA